MHLATSPRLPKQMRSIREVGVHPTPTRQKAALGGYEPDTNIQTGHSNCIQIRVCTLYGSSSNYASKQKGASPEVKDEPVQVHRGAPYGHPDGWMQLSQCLHPACGPLEMQWIPGKVLGAKLWKENRVDGQRGRRERACNRLARCVRGRGGVPAQAAWPYRHCVNMCVGPV
ncbi:hypothetical protein FIBSPDRAFT_119352 [Athelia psychrophila]|uniref:Uncharacterized protein n=1 Tax=Athelia psychrophila TaxID=1759441 RepID=A0A166CTY6_9AGAM|nr:hypothetical protein FIBSPDRAFT_119352 [Fibularhizoctonia sp. CBS 109695]